jgi:hypothetical protein
VRGLAECPRPGHARRPRTLGRPGGARRACPAQRHPAAAPGAGCPPCRWRSPPRRRRLQPAAVASRALDPPAALACCCTERAVASGTSGRRPVAPRGTTPSPQAHVPCAGRGCADAWRLEAHHDQPGSRRHGCGCPAADHLYEAVAALLVATARGVQRPWLVVPTGTGTTMVCALLVQRRRGQSLILAHRDARIPQAVAQLRLVDPTLALGVVPAERDEPTAPSVVASVQADGGLTPAAAAPAASQRRRGHASTAAGCSQARGGGERCAPSHVRDTGHSPYTYCLLLFCPLLAHITCCYYNRFPTNFQHRYANARRRKDGHCVGTAARGSIERLSRVP